VDFLESVGILDEADLERKVRSIGDPLEVRREALVFICVLYHADPSRIFTSTPRRAASRVASSNETSAAILG